jgi:hypothetical protein
VVAFSGALNSTRAEPAFLLAKRFAGRCREGTGPGRAIERMVELT